jgi:hypothetical protein
LHQQLHIQTSYRDAFDGVFASPELDVRLKSKKFEYHVQH